MSVNVHYGNLSSQDFTGWIRGTVDVQPSSPSGSSVGGSTKYLLGSQRGAVRSISMFVTTVAGQRTTVNLSSLTSAGPVAAAPTVSQLAAVGTPYIAGTAMTLVSNEMDGMFWCAHWRARIGSMLVVNLWTWWVPSQGWAEGRIAVVASNPSVPDMSGTVPSGFTLTWGSSTVVIPGITPGNPFLSSGEVIWDGQGRAFPVTFKWASLLPTTAEQNSASAVAELKLSFLGVQEIWPGLGNPSGGEGFDASDWVDTYWAGELTRLHDWSSSPLGIIANGRSTGGEGDQMFVGAAAASGTDGLLTDKLMTLVSMVNLRRPCHHCESTGAPLDPASHPNLNIWDGRPFLPTYSPDQLGKPRNLDFNAGEGHGWQGPWIEHWLMDGAAIGYRLTGDPCLQFIIRANAVLSYFCHTTDPSKTTTLFWAARATGYEGFLHYHFNHCLVDTTMRPLMLQRAQDRITTVVSQLGSRTANIWQVTDDQRLVGTPPSYPDGTGLTPNWMPYQQAVGAYGLYIWSDLYGRTDGTALAVAAAQAVIDRAVDYGVLTNITGNPSASGWRGWDFLHYDGTTYVPLVQSHGAHLGLYTWVWHTVGFATLLKDNPNHAHAREVMEDYLTYQGYGGQWLPPEVIGIMSGAAPVINLPTKGAWANVIVGE